MLKLNNEEKIMFEKTLENHKNKFQKISSIFEELTSFCDEAEQKEIDYILNNCNLFDMSYKELNDITNHYNSYNILKTIKNLIQNNIFYIEDIERFNQKSFTHSMSNNEKEYICIEYSLFENGIKIKTKAIEMD